MKVTPTPLQEIAALVGGEVGGDLEAGGEVRITGVAPIHDAAPGDLTFLGDQRHAGALLTTRASAVIVDRDMAASPPQGVALLRVDHPYLAFARALGGLVTPQRPAPGIHPGAQVAPSAVVEQGAAVMAGAFVGEQTRVGAGTVVYPGAVVMERVQLGADCLIYPGVVVREDCVLGERVILHVNASIGGDGYGFVQDEGRHIKVPQVGNVVLEDDVEVGACTCIDRAAMGSTVVGSGSKIDDLVMIGHGCRIGENVLIVAQSGLAGSATLGDGVVLGARGGVLGHLTLGAGALVYSRSHVTKSLPEGAVVSGNPARPHEEQLRREARLGQVGKLLERVAALEKEVAALRGGEEK